MNKEEWQKVLSQITDVIEIGEPEPPKLIDKIGALPYNVAYYSIRSFAWITRELWQGFRDGWFDVWEE